MNGSSASRATSLTLLDRLRANVPDAWGRFVELYGPLVYGWCRRAELGPEDAADVCQEVFGKVARGIGGFSHAGTEGALRGWLRTITRNCLTDQARRRARRPDQALGGSDARQALEALADGAGPDDEGPEIARLVGRALDLLRPEFTERTWQAFQSVALDGASPARVAAQLGLSVFAVRQANFRVRRRLRAELGDLP